MSKRRWRTRMIDLLPPQSRAQFVALRADLRDGSRRVAPIPPVQAPTPIQPIQFRPTPLGAARLGQVRPGTRPYLRPYSSHARDGTWAASVFLPTYCRMRQIHGDNLRAIVEGIVRRSASDPETARRVALASTVLMRSEGVDVPMPFQPAFPRPHEADTIRQPWLRALLTGWI